MHSVWFRPESRLFSRYRFHEMRAFLVIFHEQKSRIIWQFQQLLIPLQNPNCGNSSVGRARPCQGRGRGFESRFPLFLNYFVLPGWWNGRHEGLKILWLHGCAGSSPAPGTICLTYLLIFKSIIGGKFFFWSVV